MKLLSLILVGLLLSATACKKGGSNPESSDSSATASAPATPAGPTRAPNRECPAGTSLTVEGKGLANTAFEIKKVIVQQRTDSSVTFYLFNFDAASFNKSTLEAGQVAVEVSVRRIGGLLESGTYHYGGGNSATHHTMITVYNKGANPIAAWSAGEEPPATLELMAVDGNKLCGTFAVDQKAFSSYTGYKLNGSFVVELP